MLGVGRSTYAEAWGVPHLPGEVVCPLVSPGAFLDDRGFLSRQAQVGVAALGEQIRLSEGQAEQPDHRDLLPVPFGGEVLLSVHGALGLYQPSIHSKLAVERAVASGKFLRIYFKESHGIHQQVGSEEGERRTRRDARDSYRT